MLNRLKKIFRENTFIFLIFGIFFLTVITGIKGTQDSTRSVEDILSIQKNSPLGFIGTPIEFSRARTQFIQLISLYERGTLILTEEEASATRPDAGYYQGVFRSLVPPGLSLLMYPFFLLGSIFGLEQLMSFLPLVGLYGLSMFFFFLFLQKTFASREIAALGTIIYGFGTPGIIYASSPLYHSFSLFGITLLAYWTLKIHDNPPTSTRYLVYSSILIGISVFVDYVHPLIFLPFYLYQIILFRQSDTKENFGFTHFFFKSLIIPLISIIGLLAMHQAFFGNMFQMTNTQLQYIDENMTDLPARTLEIETADKNSLNHFMETGYISRNMKGMFFNNKNSFFNSSPLLLLGILGFPLLYFKKRYLTRSILPLLLSGIVTILIYTSFAGGGGDYSVGLRYLIPLIPLLVTLIVLLISQIRLRSYMIILFTPLLFWSFLSHLSAFYTTIYSDRAHPAHQFGILQWNYLIDEVTSSYWFSYIYSTLPLIYYPIIISVLLTTLSVFLLIRIKIAKQSHE